MQPRDADAVTLLEVGHPGADRRDDSRAFVTGDEGQARLDGPVAIFGVNIGMTHAARHDLDQDLAGFRDGDRDVFDLERLPEVMDDGGLHGLGHGDVKSNPRANADAR